MMIAPNCHARREKERGEVKKEYGGIWGEEEGGAEYGVMVQHSHITEKLCVCNKNIG